jgi:hypothetical protein
MRLITDIIFWTACVVLWSVIVLWIASRYGRATKRYDAARRKAFNEYMEDRDKLSERSVSNGLSEL